MNIFWIKIDQNWELFEKWIFVKKSKKNKIKNKKNVKKITKKWKNELFSENAQIWSLFDDIFDQNWCFFWIIFEKKIIKIEKKSQKSEKMWFFDQF